MNGEIKEILRKDFEDTFRKEFVDIILELSYSNLLDYITNLKHTEDLYNQLLKDYDELQQRIGKAVEYIKQYGNLYCLKHQQFKKYYQYEKLLNILNGRSDE